MGKLTAQNASKQPFLPVLRELVRTYQAFTNFDAAHLRNFDLTPSQADVIFTLGNTEGMTFKEIGDNTLITKGTLTGVVDRLEEKGMVKRLPQSNDRRCMRVVLTKAGEKLFESVFPQHIGHFKRRFDRLTQTEVRQVEQALRTLREIF